MSSGDQMCPCTVCGRLGHWESTHAGDAERVEILTRELKVILDSVDYTKGSCKINDMVGAVLSKQVLDNVNKIL
jgi:hypothetical protein